MFRLAAVLAALLIASPTSAAYPERPIRLVVPFSVGGTTDVIARVVAAKMSESLGQQIVVDNKGGAGGTIGVEEVTRAAPDGYTIIMHTSSTAAINVWLYKNLSYDVTTTFTPVSLLVTVPNVLVVNQNVKANTVAELIAMAKAEPGKFNYGSSGNGTVLHLSGELFKGMTGADIVHIPYPGSGPAMNDLLGGHIDMIFDNLPTSIGHVKAGTLRALAVTTKTRVPALPDVPTMEEAGVPGYDTYSWSAIFAPTGTSQEVIDTLSKAAIAAVGDPVVKKQLEDISCTIEAKSPTDTDKFWREQIQFWKPVVEKSGATIE
jgi:tripartite-type tricarboxylate transporter receptor subunit TctC